MTFIIPFTRATSEPRFWLMCTSAIAARCILRGSATMTFAPFGLGSVNSVSHKRMGHCGIRTDDEYAIRVLDFGD